MSKQPDIAQQIHKYLNGELDARAMHLLEKEALNDPFLAEALEGYQKSGVDQRENLKEIHSKLQNRTNEKKRRVVLWRTIAIAVSVIVVLTIGGLWLKDDQPIIKPKLAANTVKAKPVMQAPPTVPEDTTAIKFKRSAAVAVNKKPVGDTEISVPVASGDAAAPNAEVQEVQPPSPVSYSRLINTITGVVRDKNDGSPLPGASVQIKGTNAITQTDATGRFTLKNVPDNAVIDLGFVGYEKTELSLNNYKDSLKITMQPSNTALAEVAVIGYGTAKRKTTTVTGSVATMNQGYMSGKDAKQAANASIDLAGKVAGVQIDATKGNVIKGKVTASDDGLPIPGVIVRVKGTTVATQTDASGKFSLNAAAGQSVLEFSFIGYITKAITVHKQDVLAVALEPNNNNSLAEVAVVDPSNTNSGEYHPARPAIGWSAYKTYIKENAISPDGKAGIVKLSFTVNPDNSLSDFEILRSVSTKTDSAAINLVKSNPGWIRSTDNKPDKVSMRIKFQVRKP